jgi:CRISPR-associated protein Cmr6
MLTDGNCFLLDSLTTTTPLKYDGKIYLEAQTHEALELASQNLILASHLGSVGHGSRRPLYLLNITDKGGNIRLQMRGCHWEVIPPPSIIYPLNFSKLDWQPLLQKI